MKRIISIALALVMLLSVAVVAVSAAEVNDSNVGADSGNSAGADSSSSSSGSGSTIYFDASGWKNVTQVYCHIWKRGGDSFFNWMTKKEKCTKEGDLWAYDCSKVSLKSNEDYCLCFAADPSKIQTYDTTFSEKCFGDTVKLTGNKVENPVDSEKKADEAVWTKNSGSYGPHLAFTSIGNIVGSKLCPNEKGTEVIGDWLPTYYKSWYVEPTCVDALANAFPVFGIKSYDDIQTIYDYILQKKTGEDEEAMKKMLDDAFNKAYPASPTHSSSIFKVFSYVPSPEQALKGYTYKLSVQDKKGNVTIYDFKVSDELINGVRVYKAEIPADLEISMLYYQVFDGENWASQVSADPATAENKIINYEGKVVTKSDKTPQAVTTKKENPMKLTAKTKTIKAKKLKKKKQTVKPLTIKNVQGAVTVTKVKKGTTSKIFKKITVNKKTGAITFKKGKYRKKTYKIKLKVAVKGTSAYNGKTITKVVKVKIK